MVPKGAGPRRERRSERCSERAARHGYRDVDVYSDRERGAATTERSRDDGADGNDRPRVHWRGAHSTRHQGFLSHPMTGDMPGGYGRPQQDFNTAMQELQLTLVGVVGGADAAGLTAVGIAMAADDVSRRTEKQVANLEETAAPIAEPTTTVKKMGRRRSTCKSNCLQYQGRGGEKQRCRVRGRGSDGPHRKIIMKHKSDYRRDRRHRLPDQPSRS